MAHLDVTIQVCLAYHLIMHHIVLWSVRHPRLWYSKVINRLLPKIWIIWSLRMQLVLSML